MIGDGSASLITFTIWIHWMIHNVDFSDTILKVSFFPTIKFSSFSQNPLAQSKFCYKSEATDVPCLREEVQRLQQLRCNKTRNKVNCDKKWNWSTFSYVRLSFCLPTVFLSPFLHRRTVHPWKHLTFHRGIQSRKRCLILLSSNSKRVLPSIKKYSPRIAWDLKVHTFPPC